MKFLDKLAVDCEAEECIVPPLKSMFRAYEKAWIKPEIRRGHFEEILDIARGALVFHEIRDILKALRMIEESSEVTIVRIKQRVAKIPADSESGFVFGRGSLFFHMLRQKTMCNTFAKQYYCFLIHRWCMCMAHGDLMHLRCFFFSPTTQYWRDILVNVTFASDPNKHVVEIQLGFAPLLVGVNTPPAKTGGKAALSPVIVSRIVQNTHLSFDWLNLRVGPLAWLRTAREQVRCVWLLLRRGCVVIAFHFFLLVS